VLDGADGQSEAPVMTEEEKKEKRLGEGIGIPNVIIDCATKDNDVTQYELVTRSGKLPSVEEVCILIILCVCVCACVCVCVCMSVCVCDITSVQPVRTLQLHCY